MIWLDLDSDPCRGEGGGVTASGMILCHMYIFLLFFNAMSGFDVA